MAIDESITTEYPANRNLTNVALLVLDNPLMPVLAEQLNDVVQPQSLAIFVDCVFVTGWNVESWAINLMALYSAGMTTEFIFCVPLSVSDRIGVRTIALSRHCTICVTRNAVFLYVGGKPHAFINAFGHLGLIH